MFIRARPWFNLRGMKQPIKVEPPIRLKDFDPGYCNGLDKEATRVETTKLCQRIGELEELLNANAKHSIIVLLQGMDTSGKDGTIRWVFSKTSPLGVRVAAFKAPTEEERAHDFLWRCHAVVPRSGELMVWNRSHYEDVLVPPVNGWIDKDATARRYEQINAFEDLLTETGTQIVKCFLHISADEQKKRLQARIDDPTKHWKFSMGDLEVRKQWPQYMRAYERALAATSSAAAPWYVIPANDKLHRNLMIAELLVRTLKKMELAPPKANPALAGLLVE